MSNKEHDKLVARLEEKLWRTSAYNVILPCVPYFTFENGRRETAGDIDILAINQNHFDLYEVKCSADGFGKAISQLRKARLYFSQKGNDYIYTLDSGIEPLDAVVDRLNRKMEHKKKGI